MKILHIITSFGKGGRERQLVELLKGLKAIHEVSLLVLSQTLEYPVDRIGITLQTVKDTERKKFRTHLANQRYIGSFNPDIIHYWDNQSSIIALVARSLNRCKLVDGTIRHGTNALVPWHLRLLRRFGFTFANRIVANSSAGLKVWGLLEKHKSSVIYNGMDFSRFATLPEQIGESPVLDTDKISIVMVAGFKPLKDHNTLIRAAMILCGDFDNLQFVLIGDGPYRQKAEDSLPENLKDHFLFLGNRDDVEKILVECDIGVLLNDTDGYAEGLSNSILEYMAAGLPVIATDAGGTPELVEDGVTGFLVRGFEVEQVVAKLRVLIESPSLRMAWGRAGQKRVMAMFSIDKMISSYLTLYSSLRSK